MKYFSIKISIIFLLTASSTYTQYSYPVSDYYVGFGTSVSSYFGGYFGQAYVMRVLSSYDDDYYDYYNDYTYSNDYYTFWSPIVFDMVSGYNISGNVAFEISASAVFHYNGRVDPQITSGSTHGRDYIDRNSYSSLFALPISALLKFQSSPTGNGVFIKGGPAFQYTSESYDRIREYYYRSYGYGSTYAYLHTVQKIAWLPGFTVSLGAQYGLGDGVSAYSELEYSYFNITDQNNSTALALDRAPEAQLFSFKTMVYFNF